jgi:hypothetical protein
MTVLQIIIELVLIVLLGLTLVHAIRLERGRAGIKRDRAELERLLAGFDDCNRQAEGSAERLRIAADAAGRALSRHIEGAANLKDDLADLIDRGERLTGQLGGAVRLDLESGGPLHRSSHTDPDLPGGASPRVRSQAERELLRALRVTR